MAKDILKKKMDSKKLSVLEKSDIFLVKYEKIILSVIVFLSVLFSLLLFDIKVSIDGDDSGYIYAAKLFLDGKQFPTWHGAFYPMFLSFFMFLFGSKLLLFKILSLILVSGHLVLLYFALKKIISPTVLFFTLLIFSVNANLLYHASQTFSEPLFLFIQSLVLFSFFKLEEKAEFDFQKNKKHIKSWLFFGLSIFLLVLTRNIGFVVLFTCIIYYCIDKKFLKIAYSVISFLIFYLPFLLYKQLFWKEHSAGFEGQLALGLYKDPYHKAFGFETFGGIIDRFLVNSNLYLSKNLLIIFGFKNELSPLNSFVSFIFYLLFFYFIYILYKNNKKVLFLLLYIGFSLAATFITQQICWDQLRLILVFSPLILIVFGFSLSKLTQTEKTKKFQLYLLLGMLLLFGMSLFKTINKSEEHNDILVNNLKGDVLYGYSPDWIHYVEICKWAAKNIEKDKIIGIRKPDMAFIYSNRNYLGIIQSFDVTVEKVIENCKSNNKNEYVIIQSKDLHNEQALDSIAMYMGNMDAVIVHENGNFHFVFKCSDVKEKLFIKMLQNNRINFAAKSDVLTRIGNQDYGFYPDSILNFIKRNKINYIIDANLRSIPTKKTGLIMSNIRRMRYSISFKYPVVFEKIHQEGLDDDEPTELYKLHY